MSLGSDRWAESFGSIQVSVYNIISLSAHCSVYVPDARGEVRRVEERRDDKSNSILHKWRAGGVILRWRNKCQKMLAAVQTPPNYECP